MSYLTKMRESRLKTAIKPIYLRRRAVRLTANPSPVYSAAPAGKVPAGFSSLRHWEFQMFAVIRTGGKQYKVAKDDVLVVEKLDGDVGKSLTIAEVLMLGGDAPKSGTPVLAGASVICEILEQGRGEKVVAFKKKRRKNTHRKRGHRQPFTKLKVTEIHAG